MREATKGVKKNSKEWESRAMDALLIQELRDINQKVKNTDAKQKRFLLADTSIKLTELMQGRIKYAQEGTIVNPNNGLYEGDQNVVCSQFASLVLYAGGFTMDGKYGNAWYDYSEDSNFEYPEGYSKVSGAIEKKWQQMKNNPAIQEKIRTEMAEKRSAVGGRELTAKEKSEVIAGVRTNFGFWGVSHMAYNRSLLEKPTYNVNDLKRMASNPGKYEKELKDMKGMVIMMKYPNQDGVKPDVKVNGKVFKNYHHVVQIVGYDKNKKALIINQSSSKSGGVRKGEIELSKIRNFKYFDIRKPKTHSNN